MDRRTLLIGGGAAAGLVVAFKLWPREYGSALDAPKDGAAFDHYLTIAPDGRVTVAVPQAETGQGVWTALPQILADELGADWDKVAVVPAPSAPVYANALIERPVGAADHGLMRITAGSTSVRAFEAPLRHAGAVARTLLCAAAAKRWGVAAAKCDTDAGYVVHEGKRLAFGSLAAVASSLSVPNDVVLRAPGVGRLAGQSVPRLDLPAKTDGSFRLAADVRLPGMRFASVRLAPRGGQLTGHGKAEGAQVLADDGWIAAVARTWWAADQALAAAAPRFSGPTDADDLAIGNALRHALRDGSATTLFARGDHAAAIAGSRPLAAVYEAAPVAHHSLEPIAATARVTGDRLEVWAATQAPEFARRAAAQAAGVPVAQTTLYPMPVGDGSGRAIENDLIAIAASLARRVKQPVQAILSRAQSLRSDRPRPPMLARLTALPNGAGGLSAWSARAAGVDGLAASLDRLTAGTPGTGLPGLMPPYAIPAMRIEQIVPKLPIEMGYMRGGSEAFAAFANESFVDELARATGAEPLAFRIGMLGGNLRLARVLTTATALAGWDGGGAGSSMGLAAVSAFGSFIAVVASASVDGEGRIAVSRIVAAVDCGRMINPGLVRQQIEGGLIAGLAQATATAPTIRYGQIVATRPQMPRLGGTPKIEIELLSSNDAAGGISGLGFAAIAPAVANALAAATGRRLRKLPLDPMG